MSQVPCGRSILSVSRPVPGAVPNPQDRPAGHSPCGISEVIRRRHLASDYRPADDTRRCRVCTGAPDNDRPQGVRLANSPRRREAPVGPPGWKSGVHPELARSWPRRTRSIRRSPPSEGRSTSRPPPYGKPGSTPIRPSSWSTRITQLAGHGNGTRRAGIRVPIVVGDRLRAGSRAAEKEREVTALRFLWKRQEVLLGGRKAYIDLLAARRTRDSASSRATSRRAFRHGVARVAAQAAPEVEVLKSKIERLEGGGRARRRRRPRCRRRSHARSRRRHRRHLRRSRHGRTLVRVRGPDPRRAATPVEGPKRARRRSPEPSRRQRRRRLRRPKPSGRPTSNSKQGPARTPRARASSASASAFRCHSTTATRPRSPRRRPDPCKPLRAHRRRARRCCGA